MASTGGYVPLPWEPPHEQQLPCLDPVEHESNAQCAVCWENIEESDEPFIVLTSCGHWACAACGMRRNSVFNPVERRYEEQPLTCPQCRAPLEPAELHTRRTHRRALRFPFCVGRPSDPPNYLGRKRRDPDADGNGGGGFVELVRAPRLQKA